MTKFAIGNYTKQDFLASLYSPKKGVLVKEWHGDPGRAMVFANKEKAQAALDKLDCLGRPIYIVSVSETPTHVMVHWPEETKKLGQLPDALGRTFVPLQKVQ